MSLYAKTFKIGMAVFMLIVLIVLTAILSIFYFSSSGTKLNALLGGVVAGLVIAIIQFIFSWEEHRSLKKFKDLKIKRVLLHRDDREFYQKRIETSKKRIDVMGVTASRFMDDFARDTDRSETKVLLNALNRKVKVRILVPDPQYLDEEDKSKAELAKKHFIDVKSKYSNFEYKYFNHVAAHSLVVTDDKCLIGPCFPDIKSKDTPCIDIDVNSPYSEKYLDYFENEWNNANTK
jgi:hypothetical protein